MPELTEAQLRMIRSNVSEGVHLEEVLQTHYPSARIAIIRGFDEMSEDPYTKDAFYSHEGAGRAMAEIPPNGSLPDTYHIVAGTVSDLNRGMIIDQRTEQPLDSIDASEVYAFLREKILG